MNKKENIDVSSAKESKKCDCGCGPDCKCGCQEGEKCTCGCSCGCGCSCKKKLFKLFAALIIFFAGVGVGCCICCSCCNHQPKLHSLKSPMPAFEKPAGNVIIINTDGDKGMPEIINGHHNFKHKHNHHDKNKMNHNKE